MRPLSVLLASLSLCTCYSQHNSNFTRLFQLSVAPSISTNGMHPGGYSNYFSFNITSGYSAANYLLEVGGISNLNENETRGLQFAGLVNVTGGNAFAGLLQKEIDKRKREGFEANLSGAQFSGLANLVVNNVFGWQTSGGVNVVKGALHGMQIAGVSNAVYKYAFGVQLSGVYNIAVESMDGVQIASGFNITEGGLYGVQIGAVNKAGSMEGINSFNNDDPTAMQIGVVNYCKKMNGFQIGIINFGGRMQGTQLGLINIFHNGKTPETRDGTAIGLINIGSSGHFALYTNDLFLMNVEVATGSVKNKRMNNDATEKHVRNALIYSRDPGFLSDQERWAIGYGLRKYFFNRSPPPVPSRRYFVAFGSDLLHINHEDKKLTKELSLLIRATLIAGSKLLPKNKFCFFFASISYNYYLSDSDKTLDAVFISQNKSSVHWPGFSAGIMID